MIQSIYVGLYEKVVSFIRFLGGVSVLLAVTIRDSFSAPRYPHLILEQIYQIGNRSLPLVVVTAVCVGMVMTLQYGIGLEKFGGKLYIPKLVSLSIIKELGPVFTSLMLAARAGAGMAAEIGSMKVTQQIDAIRALGTSPIRKIVMPRVIASLISMPIMCVFANTVGVLGGALVASYELGLEPAFYMNKVFSTIKLYDYITGVGKTVVFSLIIASCSCYYGLNVKNGTREVGLATTHAVVTSSISILISDFFLTKFFWIIDKWMR